MSYNIVVARYNEDIEWLRSEMDHCIIYNKGDALHLDHEIRLKNVGRESETYLQYIITHYHELPEVVVFTQARISDHKGHDDVQYLLDLKNQALRHSTSQNFRVHHDVGKDINWDKRWNVRPEGYYLKDNYKHNPIPFVDWFKTNIHPHYPNPIRIYSNAIFSVKRENILKRSLDDYKRWITEVNHHSNSAEGHFFERSWYYIFNSPPNRKRSRLRMQFT